MLIEGGGNVLGQAFDARLVDKVQFYLAPVFTGGPVLAVRRKGRRLDRGWRQTLADAIRENRSAIWSSPAIRDGTEKRVNNLPGTASQFTLFIGKEVSK